MRRSLALSSVVGVRREEVVCKVGWFGGLIDRYERARAAKRMSEIDR